MQLLPGEYDAVLKWPFQEKIVFTLYDQQEQIVRRKNFVYELTPNCVPDNDVFLQRPTLEAPNLPFGCQLFAPLDNVLGSSFVDGDAILLGISVVRC